MKILLINIRYVYISGPERYLFNLSEILLRNGHQVIPFSIKYPGTTPSEYESYFVSPLSDDGSVFYKNQKKDLPSVVKTLERNFYSKEVEVGLSKLIDDTKPDFAFVLLYLRKLSPAVLVALRKKKVPFAVRLSDYGMICPSHNLFRQGSICEKCLKGSLVNSIRHKCVHDSYAASIVNYAATQFHRSRGYFDLIEHFVSPSRFLIKKMIEAGWDARRFHHLPTFAKNQLLPEFLKKERQIIYFGRLEIIKGVHVLLEAVMILKRRFNFDVNLIVAGTGDEKYEGRLRKYCIDNDLTEVVFPGEMDKQELFNNLSESCVSVVPSLCYDNMPNSALESLALGVPVMAPAHGCFPEIVVDGETGLLFRSEDAGDLAEKLHGILSNRPLLEKMSRKSVEFVEKYHSPEVHYATLMSIVDKMRSGVGQKS